MRQMYLAADQWFSWFWGLTCDFWAENAEIKPRVTVKAIRSVALSMTSLRSLAERYGFAIAFDAGLETGFT
jgi:hypothetical protein